jgi:photoactive yellow protein
MLVTGLPDFETPDLAAAVERLAPDLIDALPFGAIHLDGSWAVIVFNRAEATQSGYGTRPAVGRHFFTEIAPCMDNEAFRGRIERALAAGKLDIAFSHIGDFADLGRILDVRVQSAGGGGCWIFLRRG